MEASNESSHGIIRLETSLEGTDDDYYKNAATYWETIDPTVDGMLGGFGKISHLDIEGSNKFLKGLFKMDKGPGNIRALDCGAGIGRITKHLLSRHFVTVDMVEQNAKFLEKANDYMQQSSKLGNLFCCGLQNFAPQPEMYDVIWCQWVLGHLTDEHFVNFFKACKLGLKPGGMIVVKENVTSSGEVEKDEQDSSVTRPNEVIKSLFQKAGLEIIRELQQHKFPKELYPVKMYALR